ncbi:hypothetical protein MBAV_002421 [Candidatus Magnetobacterium bavaricum]|uniref:Uncharacterized protein n=1 Tax=Candidatus Magnetobacterium bavaricum TaxID=29290 RepID=A0A0F3GU69_9BACT|nr:hypothetical protein MBAV_002421 [Candidatus Magnetobacterium bavaricum]
MTTYSTTMVLKRFGCAEALSPLTFISKRLTSCFFFLSMEMISIAEQPPRAINSNSDGLMPVSSPPTSWSASMTMACPDEASPTNRMPSTHVNFASI